MLTACLHCKRSPGAAHACCRSAKLPLERPYRLRKHDDSVWCIEAGSGWGEASSLATVHSREGGACSPFAR